MRFVRNADRTLFFLFSKDSLSSGDDEDYDEDPEDAGNGNGEFLITIFQLTFLSETLSSVRRQAFPTTRRRLMLMINGLV